MNRIKVLAAAKSLSDQWMPANPAVHDAIVSKLHKGAYAKDMTPLLNDLMGDLSLFGYCLRKLLAMVSQGEIKKPPPFDLLALFNNCGSEKLCSILDIKCDSISLHRIESVNEPQLDCMHQMLVHGTTAETLSEKAKFPAGVGFASGFMRQLGLTLIAWNYPHIFRQALKGSQRGVALDQALSNLLGYSPKILALTVARDWGFGNEMLYTLGDKQALSSAGDAQATKIKGAADILTAMCEVGETLARANNPEMYPEARGDWQQARKKIEHALGPDALSLIDQRLQVYCKGYLAHQNEQISKLSRLQFAEEVAPEEASVAVENSKPAFADCSPKLRSALVSLHDQIRSGKPNKESVLFFAHKVVPVSGFSGGSIFMYDIENKVLIPRFRFGDCALASNSVPCSALESAGHPAAQAFRAERAVVEHNPWEDRENSGYAAQVFGNIQRVGVIYLQISRELENLPEQEITNLFEILRRAFMDCLSLR